MHGVRLHLPGLWAQVCGPGIPGGWMHQQAGTGHTFLPDSEGEREAVGAPFPGVQGLSNMGQEQREASAHSGCEAPHPGFLMRKSGAGPENLHFQQVPG